MYSAISEEQVESLVEKMLMSEDLRVAPAFEAIQRQLLRNCTLMLLQLVEDLTSTDHMSVSVLGHALRVGIEALPITDMWNDDDSEEGMYKFRVNTKAVD